MGKKSDAVRWEAGGGFVMLGMCVVCCLCYALFLVGWLERVL